MLVIDARKSMDAGIGTYIQRIVPKVCDQLRDIQCELLVSKTSTILSRSMARRRLACKGMARGTLGYIRAPVAEEW
jgi:hypothetical protein